MIPVSSFAPAWPALPADWPGGYWLHWVVFTLVILSLVLVMVMAFTWLERRGIGRLQIRMGPNRVGPFGLLQPIADGIKVLLKEDIVPAAGDKWVHLLAPVITVMPVVLVFAVVPIHTGAILADLNIGILYVVAITSLSTVGIFMAGWSSNNKYSLIAAMRAVAQMVSYEIPLVFSVIGVVMITGSLSMTAIVQEQSIPFILLQPLGFLIFFLGSAAEINRSPFDLMEADSELVSGYHTEYSGMKFIMFFLAEYGHALVVSAITATLFLGGWKGPLLPPILWFLIKVFFVFFLLMWLRGTLPRLRIDQLMGFAWKGLLPLAIINFLVTAVEVIAWPEGLPWTLVFLNLAIGAALILGWSKFFKLGGGRVEV